MKLFEILKLLNPQCCRKLCCGTSQRVREQTGDDFAPPPLLPSEPSAPPYMYSYMENGGQGRGDDHYHLDHYKLDYDPSESEPLTQHDRSTRIWGSQRERISTWILKENSQNA